MQRLFVMSIRCNGDETTFDIPLSFDMIGALSLEAMSRGLEIDELIAQLLVSVMDKDLVHKIMCSRGCGNGRGAEQDWAADDRS